MVAWFKSLESRLGHERGRALAEARKRYKFPRFTTADLVVVGTSYDNNPPTREVVPRLTDLAGYDNLKRTLITKIEECLSDIAHDRLRLYISGSVIGANFMNHEGRFDPDVQRYEMCVWDSKIGYITQTLKEATDE